MPPIVKLGNNLFEEEARFGSDFSLIMGNKPDSITPDMIERKLSVNGGIDMDKLGLFDSSSPNYTTYYPDVKAEDLVPQEADFIYPVFRMLSQTIVNADSYPIDFSKPGVLKAAMPLALGITINADHETALGNAMGSVKEVFWQNTYTDPVTGQVVPAGFNGVFKIDGKSNPRIARGIMMSPPSIHSNSVTVRFAWEKSHAAMSDEEFWNKWGSKDAEGKLIRKVATQLIMFRETSLVGLGADPYAQITNQQGKIMDAGRGKRQYQNMLSAEPVARETYTFSWKNHPAFDVVDESSFEYKPNNNQSDMEFSELVTSLGLDPANFPDAASLQAHIEGLGTSVADLEEQVNTLNTNITNLTASLPSAEVLAVLGKEGVSEFIVSPDFDTNMAVSLEHASYVKQLRDKALANLILLKGESVSLNLKGIVENADFATLQELVSDYETQLDAALPLTCAKCNSTEVSRATAQKHTDKGDPQNLTLGEVSDMIRNTARGIKNKKFTGN